MGTKILGVIAFAAIAIAAGWNTSRINRKLNSQTWHWKILMR